MKKAFLRSLSPMECTYLACDRNGQSLAANQYIVEGRGNISEEELNQALAAASTANPGINAKLNGSWFTRYWADDAATPKVFLHNKDWQGNSSDKCDFYLDLLDCRNNLGVKVYLQNNSESESKIIFRTHHAVCDGISTLHYVHEVFRALRGEELQGSVIGENEWDVAKSENSPEYFIPPKPWTPVPKVSSAPDRQGCSWQNFRIDAGTTKVVPKIIHALGQLAIKNNGVDNLLFRVPTNLRRLLSNKQDLVFGNLTGAIDLSLSGEDGVNEIHNKVISAMRNKQDIAVFPPHFWLANYLPGVLLRPNNKQIQNVHSKGECNISGIVSFIGKIKHEDLSTKSFQATNAYGVPLPFDGVSISCGIFADERGLSICLSVPNALDPDKSIAQARELFEASLL